MDGQKSQDPPLLGKPLLIMSMPGGGAETVVSHLQSRGLEIVEGERAKRKGQDPDKVAGVGQAASYHDLLLDSAFPGRTGLRGEFTGLVEKPLEVDCPERHRGEIREIVRQLATGGCWSWKDLRTCLFFELWMDALPRAPVLAVYRHPLQVHAALLRGEGVAEMVTEFDEARPVHSYVVYLRQILDALERAKSEGRKTVVFSTSAALADLKQMDGRIDGSLGLGLGEAENSTPGSSGKGLAALVITERLHRLFSELFPLAGEVFDRIQALSSMPMELLPHGHSEATLCDRVCDAIEALISAAGSLPSDSTGLRLLLMAAAAGDESGARACMDEWSEASRSCLDRLLEKADKAASEAAAPPEERANLQGKIKALRRRAVELERDNEVLRYRCARMESEASPSRAEVDRLKRERNALEDACHRARAEVQRLKEESS